MPAILTHHLFGEDAASLLPDGLLANEEDLLAFLLGNQGPDPLTMRFSTTPHGARLCRQLARGIYAGNVVDTLLVLRESVRHLHDQDKSCGRAFALGFASHYLITSMTHPLVLAQVQDVMAADPSLARFRDEVLAIMESDIDSWMLWQKRHHTVNEIHPRQALARTPRIDRAAGALVSQVAWQVFGLNVGAAEYGKAVSDYGLLFRLVDPPADGLPQHLARLGQLARRCPRIGAWTHLPTQSDECPSANLGHRAWRNPYSGETSVASFADLFHDALMAWPVFAQRFVEGDRARLEAMVGSMDYHGRAGVVQGEAQADG